MTLKAFVHAADFSTVEPSTARRERGIVGGWVGVGGDDDDAGLTKKSTYRDDQN